ncbi:MAG: hypothetical protein KDA65_05730 [Planctomycetaceae bacterium]|nr:hypothetical protein [Planctomycetaceae bacterium]
MKRFFLLAAVVAGLFCVANVDSAEAGKKNWGGNKGGFKQNWNGGGHKNFHNHNHKWNGNKHWNGGHKFHGHNNHYYGGYGYGSYGYGGYGKGVTVNTPGFSFGIYK